MISPTKRNIDRYLEQDDTDEAARAATRSRPRRDSGTRCGTKRQSSKRRREGISLGINGRGRRRSTNKAMMHAALFTAG